MNPFIIDFPSGTDALVSISAYRLFGLLACAYLLTLAFIKMRRFGVGSTQAVLIVAITITAFFIGSRLLYSVLYLPQSISDPGIVTSIRIANFSLHGGLGLALLSWWVVTRRSGLPFLELTDRIAPHVGIAIAVMRIGCFLNGCCFGKTASVSWAVRFPFYSQAHIAQIYTGELPLLGAPAPVHPTQLYEMAAALIAAALAWLTLKKSVKKGLAAAVFGFVYTLGRFITFFFRSFPAAEGYSNFIRGPVVYSLAILFFAAWIIRALQKKEGRSLKNAVR